jgi:hypothetical protein
MNLFFVLGVIDFDSEKIDYSQLRLIHQSTLNTDDYDLTWKNVEVARLTFVYKMWWGLYRLTPNSLMMFLIEHHWRMFRYDVSSRLFWARFWRR